MTRNGSTATKYRGLGTRQGKQNFIFIFYGNGTSNSVFSFRSKAVGTRVPSVSTVSGKAQYSRIGDWVLKHDWLLPCKKVGKPAKHGAMSQLLQGLL